MPYIQPTRRAFFDDLIERLAFEVRTPGEFNYIVTRLAIRQAGAGPNYASLSAVVGGLECAKLELYRRLLAPYEDLACATNGDVYE